METQVKRGNPFCKIVERQEKDSWAQKTGQDEKRGLSSDASGKNAEGEVRVGR